MKLKSIVLALCATIACANSWAWDLSSLKNINLGDVVNSLVSTDNVELSDLTGTWKSVAPAIVFKSENLLQKAGGTAAEAAIEQKLQKYYDAANMDEFTITFDGENNYTMTFKNGRTTSGTVTKGTTEGTIVFNFSALGSTKLRQVTAYVTKGTQLSITFDISKLNTLLSSVSKYTGNSTISSLSSLLNSYKGMYAGFKFEKQ
ncbi:MAG: lipocalin-like domain-containing protein [Muribaculaceae bacterium]